MGNLEDIRDDLAAFADDDSDVIVERDGSVLFIRNGVVVTCSIRQKQGALFVEQDGDTVPYRRYLMRLARLELLAERILAKRPAVPNFIDGPAILDRLSMEPDSGRAVALLAKECAEQSPFATSVIFLTADAGHGKTALLRQYQHVVASDFLEGKSAFLFWHVDLQGRQLLRLSEALMGDLGDLRVPGLWMPAIIRLMRMGALVLAIDGFDELAAEQGGPDALGALAVLVQEMQDQGVLVAASRRTFFDTDDYLTRSKMFGRNVSRECRFHQLRLSNWTRNEVIKYLVEAEEEGRRFSEASQIYEDLLDALGGDSDHPMATRPFLVTHLAKALLRYEVTPAELITSGNQRLEELAPIVAAFIKREVEQKWKTRDTGEPYLTAEQHLQLLASVAEEMWLGGTERLRLDVIEEVARVLLEGWGLGPERQRQVLDMIRMHVLLTVPAGSSPDYQYRAFDHPEFLHYFTAMALVERLEKLEPGKRHDALRRFLAVQQLSDSAARYAVSVLSDRGVEREVVLDALQDLLASERRPTFIHPNAGTLSAFLLNGMDSKRRRVFKGDAIFSSLVLEGTTLANIEFNGSTFVNASFCDVNWFDVRFVECEFNEPVFDANAQYEEVVFDSCTFSGIRIVSDQEERREYSPLRIQAQLAALGTKMLEGQQVLLPPTPQVDEERRRIVHRVLRAFRRSTSLSEGDIDIRMHSDKDRLLKEIIPMMLRHRVVQELEPWRGSGPVQRRWGLVVGVRELLAADGSAEPKNLSEFWDEVNSI